MGVTGPPEVLPELVPGVLRVADEQREDARSPKDDRGQQNQQYARG
ncbi:MAG TPA: hypothetical protein VFE21_02595 [Rubrobacteraceae bacterium]|nr:hypothetical protein [Rubrobacteraceae bacterium]